MPRGPGRKPRRYFICRWVKCGSDACKSCPHGPYWYQVVRVNGRRQEQYIGKSPPQPDGTTDSG